MLEDSSSRLGRLKRLAIRFAVVIVVIEIGLSITLTLLGVSIADVQ